MTCAAGKTPVRTAEEMMARYPQSWNAQTGARYTVVAFVFPKERLAAEVEEAAARMGALQITQADLEREVPRMRAELANMFDSASPLAASNRAWMRARPGPAGSQKGGVIEQIGELTVEDVRDWHAKHYKPVNARLVLVGPFEAEAGRDLVAKHFGPIAKGEPVAARAPGPAPESSVPEAGRRGGWAARAWRSAGLRQRGLRAVPRPRPSPVHALDGAGRHGAGAHPAVRAARRARGAHGRHAHPAGRSPRPTPWPASTRGWRGHGASPWGERGDVRRSRPRLPPRARSRSPDVQVAMNPYGAAFGIARRAQLGLDGAALGRALAAVDQAAFDAMRERVFGEGRGSTAAVVDPHPAR